MAAGRIKAVAPVFLVFAYPFLASYLIRSGWSGAVLGAFALVIAWRGLKSGRLALRLAHLVVAGFLLACAWWAGAVAVKLIPAFVYLSLAMLFGHTLMAPPSLCERLVRVLYPEFKPGISEYLNQLTWIWTGFFAINVVICALLPFLAGEEVWMFYTGVWVYVLMGALVVGEYFYRPRRFPDLGIPPFLESMKVMIQQGPKIFRELRR